MHIFPYSRRAGTTADKLLSLKQNGFELVDPKIVKQRMKTALAFAQKFKLKYLKKQKGKILSTVIEEQEDKYLVGTSENYVKVYIEANFQNLLNTIQKVNVLKPFKDGVLGILEE